MQDIGGDLVAVDEILPNGRGNFRFVAHGEAPNFEVHHLLDDRGNGIHLGHLTLAVIAGRCIKHQQGVIVFCGKLV